MPVDAPHPSPTTEIGFDAVLAERIVADGLGVVGNDLLGAVCTTAVELTPGRLVVAAEVTAAVLNPFGVAHGGVAATLVDHCTGVVAWPLAPAGSWPATTRVDVDHLAPLRPGPVRAVAVVRHDRRGRLVVDTEITSGGRVAALGRGLVTLTRPAGRGQSPGTR